MERIVDGGDRDVRIERLRRPLAFRSPFGGEEFVLLLADGLGATEEERRAMAAELMRQGCRYAICSGRGCVAWEDDIDWAVVAAELRGEFPIDRVVMTTSHPGWAATEIVDWLFDFTSIEDFEPRRFLVLILGDAPDLETAVRAATGR
jgi:hypothetical protein